MRNQNVGAIRNDHVSGASYLTSRCLQYLVSAVKDNRRKTTASLLENFLNKCDLLIQAQPFMASIRNDIYFATGTAQKLFEDKISLNEFRSKIIAKLEEREKANRTALRNVGSHGSEIIDPNIRILSYSASGSVEEVFLAARRSGIPFSVILSEARPMNEGIDFARRLSRLSIPVSLVIDMHLPHYSASAHCMIVGADWISETQFTNKIGTGLLVDLALQRSIPVYVAASTHKILAQKYYPLSVDSQPEEEILRTTSKHLTVKNRYFEAVPLRDGVRFITENGIVTQEEIVEQANNTAGRELMAQR